MNKDYEVLKMLGSQLADIAAKPEQAEKKHMWRRLNGLSPVRPMVCMDQLPWHELNVDETLALQCEDPFLRTIEQHIRRTVYKWRNFPADMVVEDYIAVPKTVHGLNYGLKIMEETLATDQDNDVISHRFIDQCETEEALNAIAPDQIMVDEALDASRLALCQDIFKDIMDVKLTGIGIHSGVWDRISQARPIESILYDIADRPEFLAMIAEKFRDLTMSTIDQCEALGLLDAYKPLIHCTGAYVDELPPADFNPARPMAKDCWTFGMAQMFSTVGPDTHEELEIDIMKPLYERFGLVYYGCCEPLENKIQIIRKIKNVRKISVSPWANIEKSAERIGKDFVFSGKAHPAFIAMGALEEDNVRKQVSQMLEACKRNGTPLEIVLKDVSTVAHNPHVLVQWEKMIMDMVQKFNY